VYASAVSSVAKLPLIIKLPVVKYSPLGAVLDTYSQQQYHHNDDCLFQADNQN